MFVNAVITATQITEIIFASRQVPDEMKMIRKQTNGEALEGLRRLDLFDRLTKRDASQFRGQNRPSIRRNHGEEKRPAGDFPAPIVRHRVSPNLVGWVESSEPTRTRLDWNATG